jgi:hypothetical protein
MTKQSPSLNQGKAAGASKLKLSSAFLAMALSFYCVAAQAGERAEALALLARLLKEEQERQAQLERGEQETAKNENESQEDVEANVDSRTESALGAGIDADFIAELIRELDAESEYFFESESASLSGGQVYFVADDESDAAEEKTITKQLKETAKEEGVNALKKGASDAISSVQDAATGAVSDSATIVQETIVEKVQVWASENSTVILGGVAAVGAGVAVVASQDDGSVEGGSLLSAKALMVDLTMLNQPGEAENLFGTQKSLSTDVASLMYEIMLNSNGLALLVDFGINSYLYGQFDAERVLQADDEEGYGYFDKIKNDAVAQLFFSQLYHMALENHPVYGNQKEEMAFLIADYFVGTHPSFNDETMVRGVEFINLLAQDHDTPRDEYYSDAVVITSHGFNVFDVFNEAVNMDNTPPIYWNIDFGFNKLMYEALHAVFVWDTEEDYQKHSRYGQYMSFYDTEGEEGDDSMDEFSEEDVTDLDDEVEDDEVEDELTEEEDYVADILASSIVFADIVMDFENPNWFESFMNLVSFDDADTITGAAGSGIHSQYKVFLENYFDVMEYEYVPVFLIQADFKALVDMLESGFASTDDIEEIKVGLLVMMEQLLYEAVEADRQFEADYYAKLAEIAQGLGFSREEVSAHQDQFSPLYDEVSMYFIWNIDLLVVEEDAPCETGRDISNVVGLEIYNQDSKDADAFDNDDHDFHVYVAYGCVLLEPVSLDESDEYVVTSVDDEKHSQADIDSMVDVLIFGSSEYLLLSNGKVLMYDESEGFVKAYQKYGDDVSCNNDLTIRNIYDAGDESDPGDDEDLYLFYDSENMVQEFLKSNEITDTNAVCDDYLS